MKKISKRVIMLALAMAMLCTLTVAAFAAVKTGSFTVRVGTTKYNGNYTAALYVYDTHASASLNISDYTGFLTGEGALVKGQAYGSIDYDPRTIGDLYERGTLSASASCSYSSKYQDIYAECTYSFESVFLCTLTQTVQ